MSERSGPAGEPARVPALDGLRGVAILLVMACHLVMGWNAPGVWRWLVAPVQTGWLGVDLFFALSGYLITAQLLATRGAPGYFRGFYARRLRRIWPLYLLLVATFALAAFVLVPGSPWAAQTRAALPWLAGHLGNVPVAAHASFSAMPAGTAHLWSLAVEEQFYLVWPLVVAACRPEALLRVIVAGEVASVGLRLALREVAHPVSLLVLPFTHAEGLMLGAAVAVASARGLAPQRTGPAVAVAVYLAVAAAEAWTWKLHPIVQGAGLFAWSLAAAGLVAWATTAPRSWLDSRWLRWCGRRSYGLYLWHLPMLAAAGAIDPPDLPRRLLVLALAFPVAEVSWRWWERRWLAPACGLRGAVVAEARP